MARAKPQIVAEESEPGLTTDTATAETVRRMGRYIRKAIADPACQAAAEYAWRHFAGEQRSAPMLAWAAFWYVKHCVTFRLDEATMLRIGRPGEFDLLIAPDVLVRMKDPAEDCDGFTMLVAALYSILAGWFLPSGAAPVYIATVAAGPDDPERWSHVFAIAVIDGRILPLDASHGVAPGWMVPPHHIFRFQAWSLDAEPVTLPSARWGNQLHGYVRTNRPGLGAAPAPRFVAPPNWKPHVVPMRKGMTGLRRRRGVGQDESDFSFDPSTLDLSGTTDLSSLTSFEPTADMGWIPTAGAPASSSTPFNWSSFLNNLVSTAGSVAKVAETPMQTYRLPNGTVVTTPVAGSVSTLPGFGDMSGMLPLLAIGAVLLILANKNS